MLRALMIVVLIFAANNVWALDWGVCQRDLNDDLRKDASESYLVTAIFQANMLENVYNDIVLNENEYPQCNTPSDGTQHCVDNQRRIFALITRYQTETQNFNNLMLSQNKVQAKEEACGFKLD